jgi:hypothetical protein
VSRLTTRSLQQSLELSSTSSQATLETKAVRSIADLGEFELRPADAAECVAWGVTPQEALTESIELSWQSYLTSFGGEPLCVWGYRPTNVLAQLVDMWMLSTPAVGQRGVMFARESDRLCRGLLREFRSIRVLVSRDHALAVRWLEWLGFRNFMPAAAGFMFMQKDRTEWES